MYEIFTLYYFYIQKETTIHLVLRLLGGATYYNLTVKTLSGKNIELRVEDWDCIPKIKK